MAREIAFALMLDLSIHKKFRQRHSCFALNVELKISAASRRIVFFGPSGSGKSLTLKAIAGLVWPESGWIKLCGCTFFDSAKKIRIRPQKRHIGYLPQDYALFPHLNALQNIAYPHSGPFARYVRSEQKAAATLLMQRFAIANLAALLPGELSGGQQQRVALARAINPQPVCLLLDEPFSALDPLLRCHMRSEILAILRELMLPAIFVTHDPEDVAAFAGELVLFESGRVRRVPEWPQLLASSDSPAEALRRLAPFGS